MNYALDLGFVAFENWWQVSAFIALIILYLILNVIPAIKTLLYCITNKEMILEVPFFCLAILIPIIGSIMGAIAWNENKKVYHIILFAGYMFLISVIGIAIGKL